MATSRLRAQRRQLLTPFNAAALILPVAALALASLSGCENCTDEGCGSQVAFHLDSDLEPDRTYVLNACVDDVCQSDTLQVPQEDDSGIIPAQEAGGMGMDIESDVVYLALSPDEDWSGTHSITLSITDGGDSVVTDHESMTAFTRVQPNGPNCSPTCWEAQVTI